MIQHVYQRVRLVQELDDVVVATDDGRIFDAVTAFGGSAMMTSAGHKCGTDRIAECARTLGLANDDIVLNIQGDEPLVRPEMIRDLISCFDDKSVVMGTLKKEIENPEEFDNPNVVKVITDKNDFAIYFSRFCLPFQRGDCVARHYKHIGVYAYRKDFLLEFSELPRTELEISESLEQLRVIENGYKIKVKETKYNTIGIDTPEQLKEIEENYELY